MLQEGPVPGHGRQPAYIDDTFGGHHEAALELPRRDAAVLGTPARRHPSDSDAAHQLAGLRA